MKLVECSAADVDSAHQAKAEARALSTYDIWRIELDHFEFIRFEVETALDLGLNSSEILTHMISSTMNNPNVLADIIVAGTSLSRVEVGQMPMSALQLHAGKVILQTNNNLDRADFIATVLQPILTLSPKAKLSAAFAA